LNAATLLHLLSKSRKRVVALAVAPPVPHRPDLVLFRWEAIRVKLHA
jgi:hypothetical protein